MPLCGFNKKMLEGLIAFHEGLVEHGLFERSQIRGQSVEETLQREFSDMDRFLAQIQNISDSQIKDVIENLTRYAKSIYKLIEREDLKDYKQIIESLNQIYLKMDNKYYGELEGKSNDMVQLTMYINEIGKIDF